MAFAGLAGASVTYTVPAAFNGNTPIVENSFATNRAAPSIPNVAGSGVTATAPFTVEANSVIAETQAELGRIIPGKLLHVSALCGYKTCQAEAIRTPFFDRWREHRPEPHRTRLPSSPSALFVVGRRLLRHAVEVVHGNLIYRREIPVMIGVFINPGHTPEQPEPTPAEWGDRTNRPTEYNTLDDRYPRVIVDELMPELYKDYNISKDSERHGIGGASSGAIAAFTVAWERPGDFRKVLSIVGSFVNLRGGHAYADIVGKSEKKPIRIYLQDGRNDNRGLRPDGTYDRTRDWFFQNVRLMKALTDKGYDVNYTWGMNKHGQKMGGPILPDMMRWLWRDQPVSVDVHDTVERSFREPVKKN